MRYCVIADRNSLKQKETGTPGHYGIGRAASVTDDSGSTGFRHDADGNATRVETIVGAQTYITEYAYDAIGRLTSVTYPSGRLVDYTYDSISRLATVATRANLLATPVMLASGFTYEAFGGLDGFTYGNGITLALGDDLNGRMVAMDAYNGGTPILDLDYTYDLGSRITDIDDIGGGNRGRNYVYDPLYRLASAQELAPGGTPVTLQTDYTYDAVGNRLTRNAGGALDTLAYDAFSNKLDTVTAGPVRALTYGASGNTATDDDGAGTVLTHNYDSTDRLVEVKQGITTLAAYLHNTNGQRVAKTIGATTTHYIYADGTFVAEADGGTGATQAEYVWFGGMPLAFIQGGAVYFVHANHLGTPQRITDASAAVVWDADYRPFGEATVTGALTFNLRFPGQYHDSETALHYNSMRDYDAATGRYIQSDPIGLQGGWNSYAYVGGNPIRSRDPSGLSPVNDIRTILNLVSKEETDIYVSGLVFGKNVIYSPRSDVVKLGFKSKDVAFTGNYVFSADSEAIYIHMNSYYGTMCCKKLKELYETMTHEVIHRTIAKMWWSSYYWIDDDTVAGHKFVFDEGKRRTKKADGAIESAFPDRCPDDCED